MLFSRAHLFLRRPSPSRPPNTRPFPACASPTQVHRRLAISRWRPPIRRNTIPCNSFQRLTSVHGSAKNWLPLESPLKRLLSLSIPAQAQPSNSGVRRHGLALPIRSQPPLLHLLILSLRA